MLFLGRIVGGAVAVTTGMVAVAETSSERLLGPGLLLIQIAIGVLALAAIYIGARAIKTSRVLDAEVAARQSAESLSNTLRERMELLQAEFIKATALNAKQAETIDELQRRTDVRPFFENLANTFGLVQQQNSESFRQFAIEGAKRHEDGMLVMAKLFDSIDKAADRRHEEHEEGAERRHQDLVAIFKGRESG